MTKAISEQDIAAAFADAKQGPGRTPGVCRVGAIIAEHPALQEKIMDQAYSGPTVARVLKQLRIEASATLIRNHRRGDCRCMGVGS